jgi:hypothetical protein
MRPSFHPLDCIAGAATMSSTRSLRWQGRQLGFPSAKACRFVALLVLAWLIAAAAVLTGRGYAGALRSPLEPVTLLAAGTLMGLAGVIVRLGWFLPLGDDRIGRRDHAVQVLTAFAVAGLCGGLSLPPGTPPEALILLRLVFVAEEGWAWFWFFRKWQRSSSRTEKTGPRFRIDAAHPATSRRTGHSEPPAAAVSVAEPLDTTPPPEVLQQLTRSRAADGTEELFGWLRTPLAAGQRTASVHVAFCPPLDAMPEVEVEQIDGPEARIKMAQVLPYGARFDLKLASPADAAATVVLQFMARTPQK